MVSVFEALGLAFIVLVNSAVAALLTRFFRVRLKTDWGSAVYVAVVIPVVLLILTMLFGTIMGPNLGSTGAVIGLTVVLPMSLGVSFDYFWMPTPEEVNLPDRRDRREVRR
ncbi:MAG: hypothetical protein ACI8XM_002133 [Haloarculaceae archaeon]|jgi:hypothetical protein